MYRILIPALLAGVALPAHAAFKCVDPKGISHYEDVPPAACADVVIQEVSPSGRVVRTMEPRKAPAAPVEPAKKMESDRAALDRQRRDRTLLDTFSDEREIDTARDRSLDLIRGRKQSAQSQLDLVTKRRKQLEANKSARKSDVEGAAKEQASIEHAIAGYDAEMDRVKQQFETDKVRWRELRAARPGR